MKQASVDTEQLEMNDGNAVARRPEGLRASRDEACVSPTGWRGMESAPRDGTPILACSVNHGAREVVCWQDGLESGTITEEPCEGWVNDGALKDRLYANPHWFTHWMPLPDPPSKASHDASTPREMGAEGERMTSGKSESTAPVGADRRTQLAWRIADGFSDGNEPYPEASPYQQQRYDAAADAVIAFDPAPVGGEVGELIDTITQIYESTLSLFEAKLDPDDEYLVWSCCRDIRRLASPQQPAPEAADTASAGEVYRAFKLAGPVDVRTGDGMWALDTATSPIRPVARCLSEAGAKGIAQAAATLQAQARKLEAMRGALRAAGEIVGLLSCVNVDGLTGKYSLLLPVRCYREAKAAHTKISVALSTGEAAQEPARSKDSNPPPPNKDTNTDAFKGAR